MTIVEVICFSSWILVIIGLIFILCVALYSVAGNSVNGSVLSIVSLATGISFCFAVVFGFISLVSSGSSSASSSNHYETCSICGGEIKCGICGKEDALYCENASYGKGTAHYCEKHWADCVKWHENK